MADPQIDPRRWDFESLFTTPAGEDLPDDGPGNDRVDSALQARAQSYRMADNLNWLLESQPQERPEPVEEEEREDGGLPGLAGAAVMDAKGGAVMNMGERVMDFGKDLFWANAMAPRTLYRSLPTHREAIIAASEMPRQAVGGMRDAVQSMIDFAVEWTPISERLEQHIPLGGIQILDKEGNFSPDYLSPEEWRRAIAEGGQEGLPLPEVGEPTTLPSAAIRGITQFVRRFG